MSQVCLALKGFGPPGNGMRDEMRPCFQSLEEASGGAWQAKQVPKDMLLLPDGSKLQLRISTTFLPAAHRMVIKNG